MSKKTITSVRGIMAIFFVIVLLVPLFIVGCNDKDDKTTISSIGISPTNVQLVAGQTIQLTATAKYSDGSSKQVTSAVSWSSSDAGVATVSTAGLAEAKSKGTTTITASLEGQSASAVLTVTSPVVNTLTPTPTPTTITHTPTPTPPAMQIDIGGVVSSTQINIEGVVQQSISGTSTDGDISIDIPAGTTVLTSTGTPPTSLSMMANTVPPSPPTDSCIIGLAYDLGPSGTTFDPPVTLVLSYDPEEIPADASEDSLQVSFYDNDSSSWVALPGVVDVDNNIIEVAISHFTTFAIIATISSPTETPTSTPTATPTPSPTPTVVVSSGGGGGSYSPTLTSIEITGNAALKAGESSQLAVTAHYSNGSTQQVISGVSWSSSNTAVATITSTGVAGAISEGDAIITASWGGKTSTITIEVTPADITIVDSMGRSVTIPQPLTSIVVLHSDAAAAVQALQSTDIVVGISKYMTGDEISFPSLYNLTPCGSSYTPDYETIIGLNPQVVIAYVDRSGYGQPSSVWDEKLAGTDIKVAGLDLFNPATLFSDMTILGIMLGKQDRATEYINYVQAAMDNVTNTVASLSESEKVKVYFESWTDWKTASNGSGWHDMITMVGGINIYADNAASYPVASPEYVLAAQPDVVIKQASSTGTILGNGVTDTTEAQAALDTLLGRTGWDTLPAVQNGKVHLVSSPICGGFGKPICILYLAKIFYPELFTGVDPVAFHQWYNSFQGISYQGVHIYPTP